MPPVDSKDGDRQGLQKFLCHLVMLAAIIIDSGIAKDNQNILFFRRHPLAEFLNSAKVPMGVPCDKNHVLTALYFHIFPCIIGSKALPRISEIHDA